MKQEVKEQEPGLLKQLDTFWFGHGSPTSLGVFRIFIGTLAFLNLVMIATDWIPWFSEQGYVPAWLGRRLIGDSVGFYGMELPRINLLHGVTNPYVAGGFYALVTLVAFTTAIGFWTRFSTIALAIGVVTLQHRNMGILHGGDTVLRVMCLYLALAPCGRACSVDRLVRLWKGLDTGAPVRVSLWSQRLIMYNMALIYFTTTWLKWGGNMWRPTFIGGDGNANWFPARLAEFYRFPYPEFIRNTPMIYFTTFMTLVIEFSLATLVFYRPLRKWALLGGLMLHGFIEYTMNIPLFSFLMVSMYITFYDGEEVSAWFQKVGSRLSRFHAKVRLPVGKRLDPRGVAFFDAADPLKIVTYLPGETPQLEPAEVRKSWTHSLGGWTFGWVPGVWRRLMERSLETIPAEEPEPAPKKQRAKR